MMFCLLTTSKCLEFRGRKQFERLNSLFHRAALISEYTATATATATPTHFLDPFEDAT